MPCVQSFKLMIADPGGGASDVVLDIHHGEKRFVGFTMDTKSLDADVNRKHIYGAQLDTRYTTRSVGFTMDTKSLDADVNRKHIYRAQVDAYTK
ncbi:60S ribosomal protein L5, partial [Tanacetum coccineum]